MKHEINDAGKHLEEEWKPMYGYEDRYLVNIFGKIKTLKRNDNRVMREQIQENSGHLFVRLCRDFVRHKKFIHTAVLETFGTPRPKGLECRHLDGDSKNNHMEFVHQQ